MADAMTREDAHQHGCRPQDMADAMTREYARLGVDGVASAWHLSRANADFALCSTYAQSLAVPTSASMEEMSAVAHYRSRGRLPVLCWRQHTSEASTGTLIRSAQPGEGLLLRRSTADERWVQSLWRASGASKMVLLDSRSSLAARANRFRGGGVEPARRYGFPGVQYCALRNVHYVRRVVNDLRASAGRNARARSQWLELQSRLLAASARLASLLENGNCVFLHCSDGWDRTPQMSSLAQLFLDPHYRTTHGFAALVDKEWVAFGHRFWYRSYLGQPIFGQFLDAVVQLLRQHPEAFAFNERFLSDLLAMHDGRPLPASHPRGRDPPTSRHPFDADSEKERLARRRDEAAESTWDYLLSEARAPLYASQQYDSIAGARALHPSSSARQLVLWEALLIMTPRVAPEALERSSGCCWPAAAPGHELVTLSVDAPERGTPNPTAALDADVADSSVEMRSRKV